jgi:hypothetical protein
MTTIKIPPAVLKGAEERGRMWGWGGGINRRSSGAIPLSHRDILLVVPIAHPLFEFFPKKILILTLS